VVGYAPAVRVATNHPTYALIERSRR